MKKRLIAILAVTVFIMSGLLVFAGCGGDGSGGQGAATAPPAVENSLTAEGKVVDRDQGDVLKNASICYPDGKKVACDADGSFKIEVPEGKSDVFTVEAENYKPTLVSVQIKANKSDIEIPMVSADNDEVPLVISVYDDKVKMPGNQKKTGDK